MSTRKYLTALVVVTMVVTSIAQAPVSVGILPSINVGLAGGSIPDLNFKWETRQVLLSGVRGESLESGWNSQLHDLALLGAWPLGLGNKLALGYQMRLREGDVQHRTIQQYTIVQRLEALRIGHRISSDQSYVKDAPTSYRLRYRLAGEVPLNGQSADTGESYLKLSNEFLGRWRGNTFVTEWRLAGVIGRVLSARSKLELGGEFRTLPFEPGMAPQRFWIKAGVFTKVGAN